MGFQRVYKTDFLKEGVWALLFFSALPGLILILIDFLLLIFAITSFASGTIDGANFAIWIGFCLLLLPSGYLMVYAFWMHYRTKVIFRQDEMSYFSTNLLFREVEKKIPYKKIVSVVLGWHMMEKAFPEKIEECRSFFGMIREITIEIHYEEDGKVKNLVLPIIHKKEYYDEFRQLVKHLGLEAKEFPFAFKQ
ncbi:MAG: hypothetical protein WC462_03830 [archaeon]